jgi:hypothetical protein
MFENPQEAQVVRIKIEADSLRSTSMAPSPDGPLLEEASQFHACQVWASQISRGLPRTETDRAAAGSAAEGTCAKHYAQMWE